MNEPTFAKFATSMYGGTGKDSRKDRAFIKMAVKMGDLDLHLQGHFVLQLINADVYEITNRQRSDTDSRRFMQPFPPIPGWVFLRGGRISSRHVTGSHDEW